MECVVMLLCVALNILAHCRDINSKVCKFRIKKDKKDKDPKVRESHSNVSICSETWIFVAQYLSLS